GATPGIAIYALSLHDALPISARPVGGGTGAADTWHGDARRRRGGRRRRRVSGSSERPFHGAERRDAVLGRGMGREQVVHPRAREDRKSTRLNSSHVKISYAVF